MDMEVIIIHLTIDSLPQLLVCISLVIHIMFIQVRWTVAGLKVNGTTLYVGNKINSMPGSGDHNMTCYAIIQLEPVTMWKQLIKQITPKLIQVVEHGIVLKDHSSQHLNK